MTRPPNPLLHSLGPLALLALALGGCAFPGPNGKQDGGSSDAGSTETACAVDSDCPDPALFFCSRDTFKCEPSCRAAADCGATRRGAFAIAYCEGPLGCQCDEGRCAKALCGADSDCGADQVCRSGDCEAATVVPTAATCTLSPDFVVARVGAPVHLDLLARDGQGVPVVPSGKVAWSVTSAVTLNSAASAPVAAGAQVTPALVTGAAVEAIHATVGGATCAARVLALPSAVLPGLLRVVVTDERTGRPVPGAVVALTPSTAAANAGADGGYTVREELSTDASGVAVLLLTSVDLLTVSVFHPDYGYLTVADYPVAGSRDLALPIRRNPADLSGGARGTFDAPPATQLAHLGLAGLSSANALADLSGGELFGASVPVDVHLGSSLNVDAVPLPVASFAAVGMTAVKALYRAPGEAGTCINPPPGSASAEAAIRAGRCGTRAAWSFSADLPLAALPLAALAPAGNAGGGIDHPAVVAQLIPLLSRLNSAVVRDVEFPLVPGALPASGEAPAHFVELNPTFAAPPNVPLGFGMVARVPALPSRDGSFADSLLVLAQASTPGRGQVPLGLGAAVNLNADPLTDLQGGLSAQGLVTLRLAPAHHGLEGSPYRVTALALSLKTANDPNVAFGASALVKRLPGDRPWFDPQGKQPLELTGPFLPYPRHARYAFVAGEGQDVPARRLRFEEDPGLATGGATVLRAVFTDGAQRSWTVLIDAERALEGAQVPTPPSGFADRTFLAAGAEQRSRLLVQALELDVGTGRDRDPVGLARLVEQGGVTLDRLDDATQAFSLIDYGRPQLRWSYPSEGGTIPAGAYALLSLSGFKPGVDGVVDVTFGGCGSGSPPVRSDVQPGARGSFPVRVPQGCKGASAQLTAELKGAPQLGALAPPVIATVRATVE